MTALSQEVGLELGSPLRPCDDFGLIAGTSAGGQLFKRVRGRQSFRDEPLKLVIKRLMKKHLREKDTAGKEILFKFEASKLQKHRSCNV